MCEMLNLFIPFARPILPRPVRGLKFERHGEIQRDFAARYSTVGGVFLAGYGGGYCLCGFNDWDAVFQIAREITAKSVLSWVAALHFWSGDRYELGERRIDPEDPEACVPVPIGMVAFLQAEPPERRRHRLVLRSLTRAVGTTVALRLKSGRTLHGPLVSFDCESEVAEIDGRPVVAAEVLAFGE